MGGKKMTKSYFRKSLIVGIICLLMLLFTPIVNSVEHLYPKEDGPYNILIIGKPGSISNRENFPKLLPFLNLKHPESIAINFFKPSLFLVNGRLQKVNFTARIDIFGYRGYCPMEFIFNMKYTYYRGPVLLFGQSDEMLASEYNPT
jgi:hypothetical protein